MMVSGPAGVLGWLRRSHDPWPESSHLLLVAVLTAHAGQRGRPGPLTPGPPASADHDHAPWTTPRQVGRFLLLLMSTVPRGADREARLA